MTRIARVWWSVVGLVTVTWLIAERAAVTTSAAVPVRNLLLQYSGLLAIAWMSVGMVLAVRPRFPERWLGGLDRMYRLHKWVGISALVLSVAHWLTVHAPKWAVALGLTTRGSRGPRVIPSNPIEHWWSGYRGVAESVGEWALYAVVILGVVSLIKRIPYHLFFRTHRLFAVCYLALILHAAVLTKFAYWTSPIALLFVPLIITGTWAAVIVLLRRVGAGRQVEGTIVSMEYFAGVHALEVAVDVPSGWPGHEPGQFAFVTSKRAEGAHPYTMASAWQATEKRITFIVKELGDHTDRLRETLRIGQAVRVEGPYGHFTFAGEEPQQIWVGGGIGIAPFIARMKYLATQSPRSTQIVDLFHATAEEDETAFAKLKADALAAGIRLHLFVDAVDGLLTATRIRQLVPAWRKSTVWFCGPTGLGDALRSDLARNGFAVDKHFHQELFAFR